MFKTIQTFLAIALAAIISFSAMANAGTTTVAKGNFTGASNHITTGLVEVVKNADGSHTVILADNFSLDGAPDPRVGFGKDGKYDTSTGMGLLKSNTGYQTFTVPAGVNPADYNEIYIWCLKFSVPLGVASLL
ncbi:DM13 domain-containing protein [uncultured Tateyamaria sp.]|uniref:DM13 domain-containing protein n=1 Tax=Tateyamaria sp. TaxID=1929288 RepID=UPI00263853BA|nr:DM13 domain-containing protein [uncultured Tateyamaria sp.]